MNNQKAKIIIYRLIRPGKSFIGDFNINNFANWTIFNRKPFKNGKLVNSNAQYKTIFVLMYILGNLVRKVNGEDQMVLEENGDVVP